MEVLLALAIAALGFGVVLHSMGLQMSVVATSVERHQMLLFASQALEKNMNKNLSGEDTVEQTAEDLAALEKSTGTEENGLTPPSFIYRLETQPVTADPRVQQVTATVEGRRGQIRLSAYRLRVQRETSE